MKLMLRADVEGATGITSYHQAEDHALARALLTGDVRAVAAGLLAAGDHEIVVYDAHADGRNLDLRELPAQVAVVCGRPPNLTDWGGLDSSFRAVILVGYHARGGTSGALLPHSYSRRIVAIRVNGTELGEIGIEAAIAGDVGVPVWLATGDSAGMAEATALLPGIQTVVVKVAMGESAALCYSPARTARELQAAAERVVRQPPPVQPLVIPGPVKLEVELADTPFLRRIRDTHPELVTENTVQLEAQSVSEAWDWFLEVESEIKTAPTI